jgi:hypothetical protein
VERKALIHEIRERLDGVQLVWVGTRGDDVESACDLPELAASFSIIGAYNRRASIESMALEDLTGRRVDLDEFDIDSDPRSEHMVAFRRALLSVLSRRSALFTYRPSTFVSAVCFARRDRCRYLGLFGDHQSAFDHKPWVETAVADLGIPHIPWTYVADDDQLETLRYLEDGPIMLRPSRTSGGVGLVRVDDIARLGTLWPSQDEAYVSVAPFVSGAVPVNVGAVAWRDGVTVHHASVQLIGTPGCTNRPFGYCGNDFGAVQELGSAELDAIEKHTVTIGHWLRRHGYIGAFGIDFLVKDGVPLFTEVNPRFQGSTRASCQLSVERGESCLLLEHLAALLGREAPPSAPLVEQSRSVDRFGHFVVHNTGDTPGSIDPSALIAQFPSGARADVVTRASLHTDPGATIARVSVHERLTSTGFDFTEPWAEITAAWGARGDV